MEYISSYIDIWISSHPYTKHSNHVKKRKIYRKKTCIYKKIGGGTGVGEKNKLSEKRSNLPSTISVYRIRLEVFQGQEHQLREKKRKKSRQIKLGWFANCV